MAFSVKRTPFKVASGFIASFATAFATGLSRTTLSMFLETFAVTSVLSATSASEIVTTPSGDTDILSVALPFTVAVQVFPDFVTITVSGLVLPVGT